MIPGRVSIIVPTYNRNDLLFGRSLPSLLAQTHPDIEILVVADGMEGDELDDLDARWRTSDLWGRRDCPMKLWNIDRPEYPESHDGRWGLSGVWARNFGIEHARGEFIAALDDDDEMLPFALETLLARMDDGTDFVYGQSMTFKNGHATGQVYGYYPPGDAAITHGSFVYRASLDYRYAVDCYDRGRNADADLWIRMREAGVRFAFVPRVVSHYHRNWP